MASKNAKRARAVRKRRSSTERASAFERAGASRRKTQRPNMAAVVRQQARPTSTTVPERREASEPAPKKEPALLVVGIGASAGGLEAMELFLGHVPKDSGMAFVLVQHLDPTHKGMMVELLQRRTSMRVQQAADGLKVEADNVYVIPPNKDLSLLDGALHLLPQVSPCGLALPVDYFFRSLAEDQRTRAIGVILSGMGSDGTLGLAAIKEKGGAAFVQAPGSAKFDGMPRSAIDATLADVVAPVEDLPRRILAYREHVPFIRSESPLEDRALGASGKVFFLLRAQTGNDFSLYKKSAVHRRIERRMGLHQIDSINQYVRFLRENPREIDLLFKELLIGVTSFFRDPPAWEFIKKEVLPRCWRDERAAACSAPGCRPARRAKRSTLSRSRSERPWSPSGP